ncbi:MAG: hypothetical protein ACK5E4_02705 [Planctomycetia bacterium]
MLNPVVIFEGTGGRAADNTFFGFVKSQIPNNTDNVYYVDGVGANNWGINPAQWHKTIWGRGWKKRANSAFEWLQNKLKDNPFMQVNLMGFSRGAVTAIALAWKLNKYFKSPTGRSVALNIFAWDPIPGGQRDFKNAEDVVNDRGEAARFNALARFQLPPNVLRYHTILFEGSKTTWTPKSFWTPINPQGGQDRKEFFFPGIHTEGRPQGLQYLAFALIKDFLAKSNIKISYNFTYYDFIDYYSEILRFAYSNKSAQSDFRNNIFPGKNPFRDHLFFVNQNHFSIFKETFPNLAEALAEYGSSASIKAKDFNHTEELETIKEEDDLLKNTNTILFQNNLKFSANHKNWAFCKYISRPDHASGEALETYAYYRCDSLLVTPVHAAVKKAAMDKLSQVYNQAAKGQVPQMKDISEAEFKRVTKLTFLDSRKDQVKEVDNMLRLYENPQRTLNEKARLIVAIALQVEEHLRTKLTSDRRNGVLALAAKILEESGLSVGRNSSGGNNRSSLGRNSSEAGGLFRSSGEVANNSIKSGNRSTGTFGGSSPPPSPRFGK